MERWGGAGYGSAAGDVWWHDRVAPVQVCGRLRGGRSAGAPEASAGGGPCGLTLFVVRQSHAADVQRCEGVRAGGRRSHGCGSLAHSCSDCHSVTSECMKARHEVGSNPTATEVSATVRDADLPEACGGRHGCARDTPLALQHSPQTLSTAPKPRRRHPCHTISHIAHSGQRQSSHAC